MNAHLDIDDLLSEPASAQARTHLDDCAACQAEAARWQTVAGGVRELMTGAPPLPGLVIPDHARPRVPAAGLPIPAADLDVAGPAGRRPRTAWLAAAAAAVVVLGGAGYGLSARTHSSPAAASAALTAVRGCATLKQVAGTVTQVNGTNVVIDTASGQAVTVNTTASTEVTLMSLPLSDVSDGATVAVVGPVYGATVQATSVTLGLRPGENELNPPHGTPAPIGTVTRARVGGFTLVTADGTLIPMLTSADTNVIMVNATPSQLRTGNFTEALGYVGAAGFTASVLVQPPNSHTWLSPVGCDPSSIAQDYSVALG